eukprot:g75068.t1
MERSRDVVGQHVARTRNTCACHVPRTSCKTRACESRHMHVLRGTCMCLRTIPKLLPHTRAIVAQRSHRKARRRKDER